MKKSIQYLILYGCFALNLSSCDNPINFSLRFDEKAHFHENGSGNFEITFSLKDACKIIALGEYVAQAYIDFVKLLIADAFLVTSKKLQHIPGISHIKTSHGPNMLYFKLSFYFQNIQALNKAMNRLYLNVDATQTIYFKQKSNIYIRKDTKAFTRLAHYYQHADDAAVKSFDIPFFFRNLCYTVHYSFDQPIKQMTNGLASIGTNRKAFTLVHYPFSKQEKNLSITNKIILKPSK